MWSYMHFENQLMIQSSSDYKTLNDASTKKHNMQHGVQGLQTWYVPAWIIRSLAENIEV